MNNTIKSFVKKSNKFINSKWSTFTFIGPLFFICILNILLFCFKIIPIISPWVNNDVIFFNDYNAWLGWIQIFSSFLAGVLSIYGLILITRKNKNFIIPLSIGIIFIVVEEIIVGAIFSSISALLLYLVELNVFFEWNKNINESSKMNKKEWIISLGIGFCILIFGFISYKYIPFLKPNDPKEIYIATNDVLAALLIFTFWSMIMFKNKWGYIGLLIADIMYVVFFLFNGTYSAAILNIVYVVLDIIAFISWFYIQEKER